MNLNDMDLHDLINPGQMCRVPPESAKELTDLLDSAEVSSVRIKAALALVGLGLVSAPVREVLLNALSDKDDKIRGAAAMAFVRIGSADQKVIDALVVRLSDEVDQVVIFAAAALGKVGKGNPSALRGLLDALAAKTGTEAQARIIEALGNAGDGSSDVVNGLIVAIQNDDCGVEATEALARQGLNIPTAHQAIVEATHVSNPDVRRCAARAIGDLRGDDATNGAFTKTLLGLLGDKSELTCVRQAAAESLGRRGHVTPEVVKGFRRAIEDSDQLVQRSAVLGLGQLGDATQDVMAGFQRALRSKHPNVRREAIRWLGRLPKLPSSVSRLRKTLHHDSDPEVRATAGRCLIAFGEIGDVLQTSIRACLDASQALKTWALREGHALGIALKQAGAKGTSALAAIVKDTTTDQNIRLYAIQLLRDVGDAASSKVLVSLLDPDPQFMDGLNPVCTNASEALARLGAIAVPALIDGLTDASSDWREYWILRTLSKIGPSAWPAAPCLLTRVFVAPESADDLRVWLRSIIPNSAVASKALTQMLEKYDTLQNVNTLAARLLAWINEPDGQSRLESFFETGHIPYQMPEARQEVIQINPEQEELLDKLVATIPDDGSCTQLLDAAVALDRAWRNKIGARVRQPALDYLKLNEPLKENPDIALKHGDERQRDLRQRRMAFFDPIRQRLNALGFALELDVGEKSRSKATRRVRIEPMTFHELATPESYRGTVDALRKTNERFRGQITARMEAALNEYLKANEPQEDDRIADPDNRRADLAEQKFALADAVESDLKALRFAIQCPITKCEGRLAAGTGQRNPRGKFLIFAQGHLGRSVERASISDMLPFTIVDIEPNEKRRSAWGHDRGTPSTDQVNR